MSEEAEDDDVENVNINGNVLNINVNENVDGNGLPPEVVVAEIILGRLR